MECRRNMGHSIVPHQYGVTICTLAFRAHRMDTWAQLTISLILDSN